MNPRSLLTLGPSTVLRTSLLIAMILVSCAPAESPDPAPPEAPAQSAAPMTEEPQAPPPADTEAPAIMTEAPVTEAPTEAPLAVATSRGPDLEASDPTTVSLNSGDLQLVEFFRFT